MLIDVYRIPPKLIYVLFDFCSAISVDPPNLRSPRVYTSAVQLLMNQVSMSKI